jgi:hypothetical protein
MPGDDVTSISAQRPTSTSCESPKKLPGLEELQLDSIVGTLVKQKAVEIHGGLPLLAQF